MMKYGALLLLLALLTGCSTLNEFGIGGEPLLFCRRGKAVIDDKLIGPDQARLSLVRRFADGDQICEMQVTQPEDL